MGVSGWLFARGSFGVVDSEADYVYQNEGEKLRYAYTQGGVRFVTEFEPHPNGAVIRRDYCENLTDAPVEINAFCSRFFMEGNRYEAYTQYNGWQHESSGGWQPLVTQVVAADCGILFFTHRDKGKYKLLVRKSSLLAGAGFAAVHIAATLLQLYCAITVNASLMYPLVTGGTLIFTPILSRIIFKEKLTVFVIAEILISVVATVLFVF